MISLTTQAIIGFLVLSRSALGKPIPIFGIGQTKNSDPPTALSTASIDSTLVSPAKFSRVAYCPNDQVKDWKCGPACDSLPGVEVLTVGGDNQATPDFFVAFDPTSKSIVVSHQGTDPKSLLSDINDIKFKQVAMDAAQFKTIPSGVKVHDGFLYAWNRSSDVVLSTVTAGLKDKNVNSVQITGHSQGAAIALLDAMFLKAQLPADVKMNTVLFGLPRTGNQAFANFVDKQLGTTQMHVTNKNDPVPQVPPKFLSFQHPAGEVHIDQNNVTSACPGQENQNCQAKDNILQAVVADHLGPYFDNISFGSKGCTGATA